MWVYISLFGWSFAAATILPLGSEPAVIYLVSQGHAVWTVVAVATAGNYLGACTTYAVGRVVRERVTAPGKQAQRAADLIARYGAPALLLSWVPILGDAIVVAAGLARIPFAAFSAWTVAGKLARYAAIAYFTASAWS